MCETPEATGIPQATLTLPLPEPLFPYLENDPLQHQQCRSPCDWSHYIAEQAVLLLKASWCYPLAGPGPCTIVQQSVGIWPEPKG